jgi:hypothetical protein
MIIRLRSTVFDSHPWEAERPRTPLAVFFSILSEMCLVAERPLVISPELFGKEFILHGEDFITFAPGSRVFTSKIIPAKGIECKIDGYGPRTG